MRFYKAHCTCTKFNLIDDSRMFALNILGDDGIPNHCSYCNTEFVVTYRFEDDSLAGALQHEQDMNYFRQLFGKESV